MTIRIQRALPRRVLLRLIAAAALSPALMPRAQAQDWQTWRRDDLGFAVEMPGQPSVSEDKTDDGWSTIDAEVTFANMLFAVAHQVSPQPPVSLEEYLVAQRMASRHLGMPVVRETRFTMNGFSGVEIVSAGHTFSQVIRVVVMGNSTVALLVNGERTHEQPAARRFLDSLKLFRSP